MALADSALDYSWEVVKVATENSSMTVKYSSTDSDKPDLFRRFPLTSSQFDSAGITAVAEAAIYSVLTQWDQLVEASTANPSFDETAFIGKSNSTRYKPKTYVAGQANPNVQLFKTVATVTETADAYESTTAVVALDSD